MDAVDDSIQKKFEERLEDGSDELYKHAQAVYGKLNSEDKHKYCKATLDVVDYVEVKSIAELDERRLEKIMFGAIDPSLDEVDA